MARDIMDTTEHDGAACHYCGEEATTTDARNRPACDRCYYEFDDAEEGPDGDIDGVWESETDFNKVNR